MMQLFILTYKSSECLFYSNYFVFDNKPLGNLYLTSRILQVESNGVVIISGEASAGLPDAVQQEVYGAVDAEFLDVEGDIIVAGVLPVVAGKSLGVQLAAEVVVHQHGGSVVL